MILFNDVVEILDLADLDICVMVGIVTDNRRRMAPLLLIVIFLRNTMMTNGLAKEAQRRFTIPSGRQ